MSNSWTAYEEETLGDLVDLCSDAVIAKELNRSEASVRAKRRRMGLLRDEGAAASFESFVNEPIGLPQSGQVQAQVADYIRDRDSQHKENLRELADVPLEDMIADYVDLGAGLTQRQIARKYGLSVKEVRTLFREQGITKDSLPFHPRVTAELEDSVLVERALNAKEARVASKIEAGHVARLESEYRRLLSERMSQERLVQVAKELGPLLIETKPKPRPAGLRSGTVIHVPTADEHLGLQVWHEESFGEDYDINIATERLKLHAEAAAEYALEKGASLIYRTFVGDLFHALLGGTEHGTKLDQDTRAGKVWRQALDALRYSISTLAAVAPVEVYGVRGNHDGQFEFLAAMHVLDEAFRHDDRVIVNLCYGRYDAFRVAESLHVLDHGYGLNSLSDKAKLRAITVARQFGELDTEYTYAYIGHMHFRESVADDSIEIIRLPSLAETDEYATSLRFTNQPAASFFTLGEDGRILEERRYYA